MTIAEKINRFNAYIEDSKAKNRLVGITSEITLPVFKEKSETLDLAGMGGEIDSPSIGSFESATIEITFSNIDEDMLKLAADDSKALILRSAQEQLNTDDLSRKMVGREITVKGMTKEIDFGKLKKGGYGEPKITKEITYYKDVYDSNELVEVDKFNNIYKIKGKDMLGNISEYI